MAVAVRVGDPDGLLSAVPFLVGCEPSESVVCVCVNGSRLGMVMRADLPESAEVMARLAGCVMDAVLREAPSGRLLVGYGSVVAEVERPLAVLAGLLDDAGVAVWDRVLVSQGRWTTVCDCCATDAGERVWRPVPGRSHPVALEMSAVTGFVPAAGRDGLVERVSAGEGAVEVGRVCAELGVVTLAEAGRAWAEWLPAGPRWPGYRPGWWRLRWSG